MDFMNGLKNELDNEKSFTENGAVGYKTTGKALLDLNFAASSLRSMSESQIIDKFLFAFYEDKLLAIKWLFFLRDVREGLGERRSFRIITKYLAENQPDIAKATLSFISEYGRWDDILTLLDTELKDAAMVIIKKQINDDWVHMHDEKHISLLGKWLPSTNASSKETKRLGRMIRDEINYPDKSYRKMLTKFRAYLKVVEVSMSSKEWDKIDYSAVPSRANLIYNGAFLRNDEDRRRGFLEKVKDGTEKINSGVLFPHDIVHKYNEGYYGLKSKDDTLEELWKALPDMIKGNGNTICVADGSGSMRQEISGTSATCLSVANALAIYFAEHSIGQFKDKYITFSSRPQLVDFKNANSLREKLEIALRYNEVADTNIEAVFELILQTAINTSMSQEDIPKNILILSDMEFNGCATSNSGRGIKKTLFDNITDKYASHGYKLPRLVFWNICSRTGTIPLKTNDLGVALVSGFSVNICKMVLSNELDPYKCLIEQLSTERYQPIGDAVKPFI